MVSRVILPGKKLHGIAIYRGVDPRTSVIELHVSGTLDIIRIEEIGEFETVMHYENRVLKVRYDFHGDEFDYEIDWLEKSLVRSSQKWVIKKIGPISSKDTLAKLVDELLQAYKREKKWSEENKKPEELEKLREKYHIEQLDLNIMARTFKLATGIDKGWDPTKNVMGNEKAVWRIHEWWTSYRHKLEWSPIYNRFRVKSDKLPGEKARDKP